MMSKELLKKLISLPTETAIALVKIYQLSFSSLLGGRCRFYPSCSQYALRALRKYGFWRGGFLACWRILRCHPFSPGGIDEP